MLGTEFKRCSYCALVDSYCLASFARWITCGTSFNSNSATQCRAFGARLVQRLRHGCEVRTAVVWWLVARYWSVCSLGRTGSHISRQSAHEGGKVVSLMHRPPWPPPPPGNISGTHFFKRLSRPQGHSVAGRIMSMKNSSDTESKPAAFRFVAQCLTNRSSACPNGEGTVTIFMVELREMYAV
jgi:hypothetical protein